MKMQRGWGWCLAAAALAACGGGSSPTPGTSSTDAGTGGVGAPAGDAPTTTPPSTAPPFSKDGWTFYGAGQGLSQDIHDVSADEGGNVYVAGGDALYAKKKGDTAFQRFDATSSGLTKNCYEGLPPETDPSFAAALDRSHPAPPGAPKLCRVISVAGAAPGVAMVGFQGLGTDSDVDADWAQDSGGSDLVAYDGASLTRTRHVFIASPPETICVTPDAQGNLHENRATSCPNPPDPFFWQVGRRKLRQVDRIAVNHQAGTPLHGDMFMGGTHASITAYLHDSGSRGFLDRTVGQPAKWVDAKDVWEHDHPAFYSVDLNEFLTGEAFALAVDPRDGRPWCSNGFRTAWLAGYGADLHDDVWFLQPVDAADPLWIDLWPSNADPTKSIDDHVESLSFCDDGTLWVGSSVHGLARQDPGGGWSRLDLPDPGTHGDSVYSVACDPGDHSIWIGLGWGGVMRLTQDGRFTTLDPTGLPDFARQPVRSIQIDRWSAEGRTVYFAFMASTQGDTILKAGGVAAYSGP